MPPTVEVDFRSFCDIDPNLLNAGETLNQYRSRLQEPTPVYLRGSLTKTPYLKILAHLFSDPLERGSRLANTSQAAKRARQAVLRRARNMSQRSSMRTSIKSFLKSLDAEDTEKANQNYRGAVGQIDRAVRKGLEHRNKAARLKSRLNKRLKTATG